MNVTCSKAQLKLTGRLWIEEEVLQALGQCSASPKCGNHQRWLKCNSLGPAFNVLNLNSGKWIKEFAILGSVLVEDCSFGVVFHLM